MHKKLKNLLSSDQQQLNIKTYFECMHQGNGTGKEVVLLQCVEDNYYFGLFGQIVSTLREKHPIRAELYVLRSLNVGESRTMLAYLKSRCITNLLNNFKWTRLYRSFCDRIGYRSTSFNPITDIMDLLLAWECWRGMENRDALMKLQVKGVPAGDLINDSYLRFKPAPVVDIHDTYLFILIWQAHRDIRRAKKYFSRIKPALYLTSYSTYIQHGIPVRIALQAGTRVFSFGNYQEFSKELTLNDWLHTRNPDNYAKIFLNLDKKDKKLALANAALTKRLSGGVDDATAYMKRSAYMESNESVPDVQGGIVVFLHDFYDSPHIYREMVFADFWEWVCFTIETLKNANIPFFLKPHPNQIGLNDQVLSELKGRYPGLSMIPVGVTNKQLVDAGMSCAVTVYGTVAHEMAYLGIPTISCAHHPHISFDFCRTAISKDEYASMLRDPHAFKMDKDAMRRQSLIFYYMHNLDLTDDDQDLSKALVRFRNACADSGKQCDLADSLRDMSRLPGFEAQVSKMI